MLLVKRPSRQDLIQVLMGLLDETYTREEVVSWCQAIDEKFGPCALSVSEGLWYYLSLTILTIPINLGDGEPWFVRQRDIREYLLDLQRVGADETWQGITRVRAHQTDHEAVRWPLLMFEHTDIHHFERRGLRSVRGIFDPHGDLVEHTHLFFKGELYLLVRQYDDQAHQLMVLGTSRDEDRLREFVDALELAGS